MARLSIIAAALIAIAAGAARAQEQVMPSLAEVARQAEAAKPAARKAKKIYTNANLSLDLRGEPTPVSKAAPATGVIDPAISKTVTPAAAVPGIEASSPAEAPKESEQNWRRRAEVLRQQINQLQSRIAELTVPNELTEANPTLKKSVENDLTNSRAALDRMKARWARLEASARQLQVPSEWLEPRPQIQ